jgi:hypothetical protein
MLYTALVIGDGVGQTRHSSREAVEIQLRYLGDLVHSQA